MDNHIYAVVLEHEIIEVVHVERGDKALGNCQAYAQRLAETSQGVATVGIFQPLTKLEQIEIGKNINQKITVRASRAKSVCSVVQSAASEV